MNQLYPIIRRIRRPLVPVDDPPAPAKAPEPVPPPSSKETAGSQETGSALSAAAPPHGTAAKAEAASATEGGEAPMLVLSGPEAAPTEAKTSAKGKKPCPTKPSIP